VNSYVWQIVVLQVIQVAQIGIDDWNDQKAGGQGENKRASRLHVQMGDFCSDADMYLAPLCPRFHFWSGFLPFVTVG